MVWWPRRGALNGRCAFAHSFGYGLQRDVVFFQFFSSSVPLASAILPMCWKSSGRVVNIFLIHSPPTLEDQKRMLAINHTHTLGRCEGRPLNSCRSTKYTGRNLLVVWRLLVYVSNHLIPFIIYSRFFLISSNQMILNFLQHFLSLYSKVWVVGV